jgi:hypothetical protein
MKNLVLAVTAVALCQAGGAARAQSAPHIVSLEEKVAALEAQLQNTEAEVAALKQALASGRSGSAGAVVVDATSNATPAPTPAEGRTAATVEPPTPTHGLSITSRLGETTVGGYGELNYNHYVHANFGSPFQDRADVRRAVVLINHQFNDRLSFTSEFEWEGAVTSSSDLGEVEVEQAHVDYKFSDRFNIKAGLFLIPLGLLNESHEPNAHYGVERNEVESRIIPTTYREGGFGLYGDLGGGLDYDVGVTTYFNTGKPLDPTTGFREAHQELSRAVANDFAFYGALNYRGLPGLQVGAAIISGDTGQNGQVNTTEGLRQIPGLRGVGARLTLWDVHAKYSVGRFDLRALYARGTLENADKVSLATGVTAPSAIDGWLVEGAYHAFQFTNKWGDFDLTPFMRYERYNTQASVPSGFPTDPLQGKDQVLTGGLNFLINTHIVLKADYQKFFNDSRQDRFNLGLGYQF